MGDDTVGIVARALREVAEANGVSLGSIHAIADLVVTRLRDALTDQAIEALFDGERT